MRVSVASLLGPVCLLGACMLDVPLEPEALQSGLVAEPLLFLNEVRANEPGSDVAGEFIELVNLGSAAASLQGVTLDVGGSVRHAFASGASLGVGEALVVFGAPSAIPGGLPRAVAASSGSLALGNGGATIVLRSGSAELDRIVYTSALSGTDGVSMNRSPDAGPQASLVLHTRLVAAPSSPGTRPDGSAFAGAQPPPPEPPAPEPPDDVLALRVVAANLTSGNGQNYDAGHGMRILRGLHPDVALVQEMNFRDDDAADLRAFVDEAFGPEFHYTRQEGVTIPNGVVSRFPILASGSWDDPTLSDRDHTFARIDLPGDRDLWAISVHFPGSTSSLRDRSATALAARIASTVPARDYLVIGGDFNADSRGESCLGRLSPHVRTAGPYPVDQAGKDGTNAARKKPYDWVVADTDLDALEVPTQIGSASFTRGLVFDSRVFTPLSSVAPVQAGDSGATNMQHMAVVRDFEVGL